MDLPCGEALDYTHMLELRLSAERLEPFVEIVHDAWVFYGYDTLPGHRIYGRDCAAWRIATFRPILVHFRVASSRRRQPRWNETK